MHARFYHPEAITVGQMIELSADNKHHAARVLRLRNGDPITLFNGHGGEFRARIDIISKDRIVVFVDSFQDTNRESPLQIELAQAICVNEKMDWIIQKSIELGVSRIQPVSTARSIVHLSNERSGKRLQHWQKIAISTCEQCGRNQVPPIDPMITLSEWLSQKKMNRTVQDILIMLSTTATKSLKDIPEPVTDAKVALIIGPEGGFTADEELAMTHSGFVPLHLGNRILRTESAALAAIAAMQALWGDY
ncbi:16S rRNA (uracil(1498)-N(3))-methyltransferase [Nitrosomonas sp.]|uniref:16S rRNA (uracil(1498)-N(3))-methyltransferase n=1 Tax=Nitrosomonas sp. TaxID=42353 RepID=UPI001E0EF7AE|nr:16S rRNA (uracil(1498)-N(3))-methyltransferase [Nitrosomonas sp.]MBX3617687.1 16S rRNA (uracil(1498)-N(3))-methyltransferase [Nitrosomonas sp.]